MRRIEFYVRATDPPGVVRLKREQEGSADEGRTSARKRNGGRERGYGTLMCHLTEIPPMRRIDLQLGARVRVVGSVGPRDRWRELRRPAKNCEHRAVELIYRPGPAEQVARSGGVAINTPEDR